MRKICVSLFAALALLFSACGSKNIKDMENVRIVSTDSVSGIVVFECEGYGAADKDGAVILEPEFGYVQTYGNFIVASLSKKKVEADYAEWTKKMADANEAVPHEYLVSGYLDGYKALYTSIGKQLRNFTPQSYAQSLGPDSIYWKTIETKEIVVTDGSGFNIDDITFSPEGYTYRIGSALTIKNKDGVHQISGHNMSEINGGFKVVSMEDPLPRVKFHKHHTLYTPSWKEVVFPEGLEMSSAYTDLKGADGVIVFLHSRISGEYPSEYVYVSPEGEVSSELPGEYYVKDEWGNKVLMPRDFKDYRF